MNAKPQILIIDDNVDYVSSFKSFFEQHGIMVTACQSQNHTLSYVERVLPHVIFVSTMIRGGSYVQVVRDVKQRDNFKTIPILSYGEFDQDIDIKMAYEAGVQDYFDLSTSNSHIICKLKVWLDQAGFVFSEDVKEFTFGQYTLEVERCLFRKNDQYIPVTTSEFVILKRLLSCKGKVLTRNQLLVDVSYDMTSTADRNVDVHIASLRKKLDQDSSVIETVRGVGYKISN